MITFKDVIIGGCVLVGVLALFVWVGGFELATTTVQLKTSSVEEQFSSWDGSHKGVTKFIKASMNDPDSYKHVKTSYRIEGEHLIVFTTYRGKNVFGGVVTNSLIVKIYLKTQYIEVI